MNVPATGFASPFLGFNLVLSRRKFSKSDQLFASGNFVARSTILTFIYFETFSCINLLVRLFSFGITYNTLY